MPQWLHRRGWRITFGVIVLVILAGVWHVISPAQAMVKSCQKAIGQQLLARTWSDPYPLILSPDVLLPSLAKQTENTYILDSSVRLDAGYTPPNSFDDNNGPEAKIDYTYRCTVEYTGNPFWGEIQQTRVIETHVLTEQLLNSHS